MTALGPRPDIAEAARTMRFDLKFVDTLALLLPSALLCLRLSRPDASPGAMLGWLAAPLVLLLGAVGVEMTLVPQRTLGRRGWSARNWYALPDADPAAVDPAARRADRGAARRRAALSRR